MWITKCHTRGLCISISHPLYFMYLKREHTPNSYHLRS